MGARKGRVKLASLLAVGRAIPPTAKEKSNGCPIEVGTTTEEGQG